MGRFRATSPAPAASPAADAALAALLGPGGQGLREALSHAAGLTARLGLEAPLPCLEALLECAVGGVAAGASLAPGDRQWLQLLTDALLGEGGDEEELEAAAAEVRASRLLCRAVLCRAERGAGGQRAPSRAALVVTPPLLLPTGLQGRPAYPESPGDQVTDFFHHAGADTLSANTQLQVLNAQMAAEVAAGLARVQPPAAAPAAAPGHRRRPTALLVSLRCSARRLRAWRAAWAAISQHRKPPCHLLPALTPHAPFGCRCARRRCACCAGCGPPRALSWRGTPLA